MKFSVVCMSLLLAFGNIGADEVPKNEQRKEDYLQTYILEPSNDLEDESTTIIPPLVEGEPSPVVSRTFIDIFFLLKKYFLFFLFINNLFYCH